MTPILKSVVMDDLFYTQASNGASVGDRTPLGDLVSWLTTCAARDCAGHSTLSTESNGEKEAG